MSKILFLEGPLKERIWGSKYFKDTLKLTDKDELYGELWSCSGHKEGNSIIVNGEYKGKALGELYVSHPELFNFDNYREFPILVKLISTSDRLSIQVHPDDEYAIKNENQFGKTEGWLILDSGVDSSIVVGHNAKNKEEFVDYINNDNYDKLLDHRKIQKGEFYPIYPGMLHAIGKDILILEIQQSSDVTYRFYDYHRKDKNCNERQLHVKQALDVVNYEPYKEKIINCFDNNDNILWKNNYFVVENYNVDGKFMLSNDDKKAMIVTLADGKVSVEDKELFIGESFIITSIAELTLFKGNGKILVTKIV